MAHDDELQVYSKPITVQQIWGFLSLLKSLNGQRHGRPLRLLPLHPRHLDIRKLPYNFGVRERELEVVQEHCDNNFYE